MDCTTVLEIAVVMFFGTWFLLILWLTYRALRRSEPSYDIVDRNPHGDHEWPEPGCSLCTPYHNPQPTSPPPSAPTTGLTSGQLEQLGAKVDTDPELRAKPGSAD